jgi:3alpha(or 20beta)-hydroxysteroid dehydrogenase
MDDLTNRVALVTGAARGVGAVIATTLHAAGATVVLTDIRDDAGEAVAAGLGERAGYRSLDVTDERAWTRVVDEIVAAHDRLDVLVNDAAILHLGSLAATDPATFRRVLDVNLTGPFLGTRAVAPVMTARGSGSIVHISSIDGLEGMNGVSAYSASKFGLRGLARSTALELGRHGVRVNCVCPAGGNPEMYEPWLEQLAPHMSATMDYTNNRAIPGPVPHGAIAAAVRFLASDASAHITGIDLPVDGGAAAGTWLPGFDEL